MNSFFRVIFQGQYLFTMFKGQNQNQHSTHILRTITNVASPVSHQMAAPTERASTITALQVQILQAMFEDRHPELNWDKKFHKELLLKLKQEDLLLDNLNIGQLLRQLTKYLSTLSMFKMIVC